MTVTWLSRLSQVNVVIVYLGAPMLLTTAAPVLSCIVALPLRTPRRRRPVLTAHRNISYRHCRS